MLGRLFKSQDATDAPKAAKPAKRKKDKAIIHKSVPDEVLYPDGRPEEVHDNGWLENVPVPTAKTKPVSAPTAASRPSGAASAAPASAQTQTPAAAPIAADPATFAISANAAATGRPRYPHGWLVVVEGPGLGEWYPLEGGVSTIGTGADQTVALTFGDSAVQDHAHATLAYDKRAQGFALDPAQNSARVNGLPVSALTALRDGDVITLGGTSLRLVALCSPNFHWGHVQPS